MTAQCQFPGCGQPATHRYLYRYEPSEGHSVPVHSDVCELHLRRYENTGQPGFIWADARVVPL